MLKKLRELKTNPSFVQSFKNSLWMVSEYGLRMVSGIFVSIYVAKYLGPERFGILAYAIAIVSIFMTISRLGMDSILVRDLSKNPGAESDYMGTAFFLIVISTVSCYVLLFISVYFLMEDARARIAILIVSSGLLFQSFYVVDYGFQAKLMSKYTSIAKSIALVVSSLFKIYLVLMKCDLLYFAFSQAFDCFVLAVMLVGVHFSQKQPAFFFSAKLCLFKPLLESAWPMVLSAVAFMLYARVDQIMIEHFLDAHQLGIYAAAMKIFEGWTMLPFVVIMSMVPAITRAKEYSKEKYLEIMVLVFRSFFVVSSVMAILTTLFSDWLVMNTFGVAYVEAAAVLKVLMYAAIFTTIGTVSVRILVIEKLERKVIKLTSVGLVLNVIANWIMIPAFGVVGAAWATLLSLSSAYFFYDMFDSELKHIGKAKLKAFTGI